MTDILHDLEAAAARKLAGDPAAQQAGLFARAAAEIRRLRAAAEQARAVIKRVEWPDAYDALRALDDALGEPN